MKIVTVNPDNNTRGKPAVMGIYFLADGETGEPLALIDGQALTVWRTACASALAASYLARKDASRMAMIGAGKLAPHLIRAHAAVRPIREVTIWNRNLDEGAAAGGGTGRQRPFGARHGRPRKRDPLGRHRLGRDHLASAADRGPLAAGKAFMSISSAPSRRSCARRTTRRSAARRCSSTPSTAR